MNMVVSTLMCTFSSPNFAWSNESFMWNQDHIAITFTFVSLYPWLKGKINEMGIPNSTVWSWQPYKISVKLDQYAWKKLLEIVQT